jgi:hypothetical protein
MMPFAVLDLLADDWFRSRYESARRFGTRESQVVTWLAALRRRFRPEPAVPAALPAPAAPPAEQRRAA